MRLLSFGKKKNGKMIGQSNNNIRITPTLISPSHPLEA